MFGTDQDPKARGHSYGSVSGIGEVPKSGGGLKDPPRSESVEDPRHRLAVLESSLYKVRDSLNSLSGLVGSSLRSRGTICLNIDALQEALGGIQPVVSALDKLDISDALTQLGARLDAGDLEFEHPRALPAIRDSVSRFEHILNDVPREQTIGQFIDSRLGGIPVGACRAGGISRTGPRLHVEPTSVDWEGRF